MGVFCPAQNGLLCGRGRQSPHERFPGYFLEQQGWRRILVEPQATFADRLRAERQSRVFQVACGAPGHPPEMPLHIAEQPSQSSLTKKSDRRHPHRAVETQVVRIMTLDEILMEAGQPSLDFVSIDVEGTQLDVLRGFSLDRHRPGLLFIEDHLHTLAVHRHLVGCGYRLVKRTALNNWYIPRDQPFTLTTALERFRLWKKVWANTPFRKLRVQAGST